MRLSLTITSALLFGSYVAAAPPRNRPGSSSNQPPPVTAATSGPDIFGSSGDSLFGGSSNGHSRAPSMAPSPPQLWLPGHTPPEFRQDSQPPEHPFPPASFPPSFPPQGGQRQYAFGEHPADAAFLQPPPPHGSRQYFSGVQPYYPPGHNLPSGSSSSHPYPPPPIPHSLHQAQQPQYQVPAPDRYKTPDPNFHNGGLLINTLILYIRPGRLRILPHNFLLLSMHT
ncbi:hypothetical protein F5887DRAFT_921689 [Amanita rubescens]|nr:hypothetical protein F5887DRAFT_921689 [Amanita rubescens]